MPIKIYPLGKNRDILKANTGLDHYTIKGDVLDSELETPDGMLSVWLFNFADIHEQAVKEQMLKVVMEKEGFSRLDALNYLTSYLQGVRQDEVEIHIGIDEPLN